MEAAYINCTVEDPSHLVCNGTKFELEEAFLTYHDAWFWIYLGIYVFLVLIAGIMSGLTLGLLSLDLVSLQVLQEAGTRSQRKHAKRILPLVKRHHFLLVTLLLTNAAAVESMPLFLDRISNPITAILVSVSAVLLFGEVFPQALCSRYGLAIGATLSPLVYFLMAIFFIVAWPLSKLLDCLLGKDHSTFFRRAELKVLVDLHGPNGLLQSEDHEDGGDAKLSLDEVLIIKGALELKEKVVADAMVPIQDVFMIPLETKLDRDTLKNIIHKTHSRVPVFQGDRNNIVAVLLVKTLILVDPDDAVSLKDIVRDNSMMTRSVRFVDESKPLYDMLNEFQTGKSHLAVVVRKNHLIAIDESTPNVSTDDGQSPEVVGVITLEDVMEEIIGEEIYDETDKYNSDYLQRVSEVRSKLIRGISVAGFISGGVPGSRQPLSRSTSHQNRDQGAIAAAPSDDGRPQPHSDADDKTPLLGKGKSKKKK